MKKTPRGTPSIDSRREFEPHLTRFPRDDRGLKLSQARSLLGAQREGSARGTGGGSGAFRGDIFNQRVVIKARVRKTSGAKGGKILRAHLNYLSRSGVSIDGQEPKFFNGQDSFLKQEIVSQVSSWKEDEHHFRFIVSPEGGAKLDLQSYAQDLMVAVERDLRTKLTWFAVCHQNTDNPHIHFLVRGVNDRGQTLIIPSEYIKRGMRLTAEKEATRILGLRTDKELKGGIEESLTKLRFCSIDWKLMEDDLAQGGKISLKVLPDHAREWEKEVRENKLRRLTFLESHGLAADLGNGFWELKPKFERDLYDLERRESIRKKVALAVKNEAHVRPLVIHEDGSSLESPIEGAVKAKELVDELSDDRFLVIAATDGKLHYVRLGMFSEPFGFECRPGALVKAMQPASKGVADDVLERFSQEQGGGALDENRFRAFVRERAEEGKWKIPSELGIEKYLERFSTRLDSLEKLGAIELCGDRKWSFPPDLQAKLREIERALGTKPRVPVQLIVLSHTPLSEQIKYHGATYLDRVLSKEIKAPPIQTPLGSEVANALAKRSEHLKAQGTIIDASLYRRLRKTEELRLEEKLSKEFGPREKPTFNNPVEGKVARYERMGGSFSLVTALAGKGFVLSTVSPREERLEEGVAVRHRLVSVRGKSGRKLRARTEVIEQSQAKDLGLGKGRSNRR